MKKVFLLVIIFVGFCIKTQAQTCDGNDSWEWPGHRNWFTASPSGFTGIITDMNTLTTTTVGVPGGSVLAGGAVTSYEGVASVSDDEGNLLWYTNGRHLWTGTGASTELKFDGLLAGNEDGATGQNGSAVQGIMVVKHPLADNDYYIFTSDDANSGSKNGLNYWVFDTLGNLKSDPNGIRLGAFTTTEGIAVTRHENKIDLWIGVMETGTGLFNAYLLTCTGVDIPNSNLGQSGMPVVSGQEDRGSIAFSWDGSMFAQAHPNSWPDGDQQVSLYDFDNATGAVSNAMHIAPAVVVAPYDVTFSPDNTRLYVSRQSGMGISYFDISSGDEATIAASFSPTGVATLFSSLEIGPGPTLYSPNAGAIRAINPTNGTLETATTFTTSNVPGTAGNAHYGLPIIYIPPTDEPSIIDPGVICNTDAPINLSTTWECNGGDAEEVEHNYTGPGITDANLGTFDPSIAGVGTHEIVFALNGACLAVDDTLVITVDNCGCPDTTLSNTISQLCIDETVDLTTYEVTSDGGTWSIVNTPGGSSPATIVGESVFDATGADPGTYRIRFTLDSIVADCPDSAERNIIVNEKPVVALTVGEFCAGDSILLDAGNPGATYQWSNGGTGQTEYFSTVGPHKVIVTLSGCVDSAEVSLTINENPNVSITAPSASCDNDSPENLVATPEGGQWYIDELAVSNPAQFNPSSLGDGPHEIKYEMTNGNGCSDIDSISHTINAAPEITNMPSTTFLCASQSAITLSADPAGGQWYIDDIASSDQFDPGAVGLGDHDVKYVVSNGACSDSDLVTISVNDAPDVVIDPIVSSCDNQEIETLNATPEGGQWYVNNVLSSNQFNPAALGANTYNVKYVFSNGSGCSDSDSVSVTINVAPTVDLGPSTFFCTGDSVSLDAGPGFSDYDWSTGGSSQVVFVSSPGPVTVVVTDPNGCIGTDQVQVSANELPSVDLGGSIIVCEQDSITLDATHPDAFSYTWLPTNETTPTIRVGSEDSTYSVTIVDNDGCEFTDFVQISQESLPTVDLGSDTIICDNVTTILDAASSPDVSYTWLLDEVVIPGENSQTLEADSGEYIVIVSTGNGCESSDTINIDNHQLPNITLDAEYEFCQFDSVEIDLGSIGVSYLWSTGDITQSIWATSDGTISVEVTDANSCVVSGNTEIIENLIPVVNLGSNDSACTGLEIELDATVSGGITYVWSDGETGPVYNLVGPDTLSVIVTNDKNCVGYDTIEIKALDSLDLSFMEPENQVCFGSESDNPLNGGTFEEAQYTWTLPDGSTETGQTIVPLLNGWYVVDITDKFNCKGQDSILNIVIPLPNIDLGPDTSFCSLGQETYTVRMNFSENVAGVISWEDDFGNTDNNNSNDTLFTATTAPVLIEGIFVDDASGCSHKDSIYLEEECEETILTFPNIFVPNGSNNTSFRPIELTDEILQKLLNNILWSEFEVYNRWGIRVFQSQNTLPHWKGLFENRLVSAGTYYWIYRYKDSSVKIHSLNGFVQVLHQ